MGVPFISIPYTDESSRLLLYFHANAEDALLAEEFLMPIKESLKVHVLSIEYPGYGVYDGAPSEEKINQDAETVFDHLT